MDEPSLLSADSGLSHDQDALNKGHPSGVAGNPTIPPPDMDHSLATSLKTGSNMLAQPEHTESQQVLEGSRLEGRMAGKGKRKAEPVKTKRKEKPLRLLDLPHDVLREIVKQVTHTNDLTSLALTHSTLHSLAIPHIYSRFDIVWPDAHSTEDQSTGVDALTYGLATLVMGDEVFRRSASAAYADRRTPGSHRCCQCGAWPSGRDGSLDEATGTSLSDRRISWRRGNWYARYTRKFSVGNGPSDLVAEYLVSKERGKMLGTLVALAVARMPNLETFVWDMPSGVLRDVWLALASLGDRPDGVGCRLKQVWVRWHDNSQHGFGDGNVGANAASASTQNPNPQEVIVILPSNHNHVLSSLSHQPGPAAASAHVASRVERPTFSLLPPLESLTVLDIDEQAYLDEMSLLIGKSQARLRELRVGVGARAAGRDWVGCSDDEELVQIDQGASWFSTGGVGARRLGGILGVLVGRVYDLRKKRLRSKGTSKATAAGDDGKPTASSTALAGPSNAAASAAATVTTGSTPHALTAAATASGAGGPDGVSSSTTERALGGNDLKSIDTGPSRPKPDHKLKLELLELERVPLSVHALLKAFDWSNMTTLTILNCANHEQLWKTLRRCCGPVSSTSSSSSSSLFPKTSSASKMGHRATGTGYSTGAKVPHDYPLKLKSIHTDMVSRSLVAFLQETLAPNSLEVLLLQEGSSYSSSVTIDSIYRGPLRRHRKSLKKLMVDSSDRALSGVTLSGRFGWKKWMMTDTVLSFLVSGKMTSLRELGMAMDSKDWHYLLQRLPCVPHLRSLYITNLAEGGSPNALDPRELALQVVDIVTLRPEIELCYLAILHKCFEVFEGKSSDDSPSSSSAPAATAVGPTPGAGTTADTEISEPDDDDDEDMIDADEDDDDDDDDDDGGATDVSHDGHDNDSDGSFESPVETDDDLDSQMSDASPRATLRLREILFYDERVAIFKARHGRL